MRDVIERYNPTTISVENYASPPSNCFSGYEDYHNDVHVSRLAGRSDLLTTKDHIRPTYYHRYDLSFQPGFFNQDELIKANRKCYRSWQTPKLQYFDQRKRSSGALGVHTATALQVASCSATYEPAVGLANINTAISNALSNARNDVADLGEAALDLKRTGTNLIDRVSQMAQALRFAKRRNWKAMRRTLGISHRGGSNLPSAYLEYTYGWKPLVNDIISLAQDMGSAFGRTNTLTVKGFSSDTIEPLSGWTTTRFVEVGLVYKINNNLADGLQSYGLGNPLLTGWQALRYSFLIDWILPVGKYLQAIGGIAGTDYIGGYQLEVCKGSGDIPIDRFGYQANGSGKTFVMKRRFLATPPRPGIHLNLKLSPTRALNGLALLSQRR